MNADISNRIHRLHQDGVEYQVYRPGPLVDVFIDHFLIAKGYPTFIEEQLFTNNEIELFFNLGDRNDGQLHSDQPNLSFSSTVISGLRSSFMRIYPRNLFYIAGMRFTLFGFYHIWQIPASELSERNFQADDVLGKEINELREKLSECAGNKKFALMNDWILKKVDSNLQTARAWNKVDFFLQRPNSLIKESLPSLLGYSHKHSVHLITKMCGLSPKLVHRIYRIRSMLSQSQIHNESSWADIAYDFGFSDQSHLIREFKLFTGFTPSQLIANLPKDYIIKQLR
ncbi:MAG: helix-turn-helix transcriptional regulator [Saprospiraceae bacterium]|nr:helix-turn-helix transcriptional regulator [Saprospiraceae bacterium]